MKKTADKVREEFLETVQVAAEKLSPSILRGFVAHPETLDTVLAVGGALAGRLAGGNQKPAVEQVGSAEPLMKISSEAAEMVFEKRRISSDSGELLTTEKFAQRLGLKTRQSIHDWLKKGIVVGWEGAKRGFLLPADQLDEQGQPVPHLADLKVYFSDGHELWMWLQTPLAALDGATALALLRKNETARVLAAAQSEQQGDFG